MGYDATNYLEFRLKSIQVLCSSTRDKHMM